MILTLRPHHAMCLLNFRGNGYSAGFVENMNSILASLTDKTMVTLQKQADCVCAACRNRVPVTAENPVGCAFLDKVARYDDGLLNALGLMNGSTLQWHELKELVRTKVFPNEIRHICSDCEWFYICETVCRDSRAFSASF